MVLAPIAEGRRGDLETLLASMTDRPGRADPANPVLPFGAFDRLHVARLLVLEDLAYADLGEAATPPPPMLAFLGDCDGDAESFRRDLAARAGDGLRRLFAHCSDFTADADLVDWMRAHETPPATAYVNWVGRTVRQVREEAALASFLRARPWPGPPQEARKSIVAAVQAEQAQGRLPLSPAAATPLGWTLRRLADLVLAPLVLLLLTPFLILIAPFYLLHLRKLEETDAEFTPRPAPAHVAALARIEDHDASNQFSAYGNVKPGAFRLLTLIFLLRLVQYTTRHIFTRGRLARVPTIHFARWVFTDDKRRLFFASNYDGSLDAYMDDFINKVAYGLNLVFSNGVGYPRCRYLFIGGAKNEQKFKNYIRKRQLPTQVWYKAYPNLTAHDLACHSQLRRLIEDGPMRDEDLVATLRLL